MMTLKDKAGWVTAAVSVLVATTGVVSNWGGLSGRVLAAENRLNAYKVRIDHQEETLVAISRETAGLKQFEEDSHDEQRMIQERLDRALTR